VRQFWNFHDQLARLLWCAGWTVPPAVLGLGISIPYWQAVVADTEHAMAQQIDYEDGALCTRFGFAPGSDRHFACKLDLRDLRHSHERLLTAGGLP
jgi:hypothetical protein